MIRLTLFSLFFVLFCLPPAHASQSAVQLFKGQMEILVTSGKSCDGLVGRHDISLVLNEGSAASGGVNGYFMGGGITIGKFSGSDLNHLDVRYPFQDELRSSGHFLTVVRTHDSLTGELHDRHIEAAADDCNFDLARIELSRSEDGKASAQLVQMTGLFDAQLARSQALGLAQSKGYEAALPFFEKAVSLADAFLPPGSEQINSYLIGLATAYIWLDRFEQFNSLFDTRILASRDESLRSVFSPYRVRTLLTSGREALGRDELENAMKIFDKAYALQPRNREVIAALMSVYIRTGRYEEAIVFLQRAEPLLENEPDRRDIRGATAMVLYKKAQRDDRAGKIQEAETSLKQAVELEPRSVPYLTALARQLHKGGSLADAEQLLAEGLEKFSDSRSKDEILASREKIRQTELFLKKIRKAGS